jgi:hypothetical protein
VILHLPGQLAQAFEAKLLLARPLIGAKRMKLACGDLIPLQGTHSSSNTRIGNQVSFGLLQRGDRELAS